MLKLKNGVTLQVNISAILIVLVFFACNYKNDRSKVIIKTYDDISCVAIKFILPNDSIVNKSVVSESEKEKIFAKIKNTGIHSLELVNFLNVPNIANYYEVRGRNKQDDTVNLFIFYLKNNKTLIEGIIDSDMRKETRYKIYKDRISGIGNQRYMAINP